MQDARRHPRIAYRLAVEVYCDNKAKRQRCYTRDFGIGGLFAVGGECLRTDDEVSVELGPSRQGALHVEGRIARVSTEGAGVEFAGNSPATIEILQALLQPDWEGGNLLDGVITIAPWYQRGDDLAGWMRLTSIVSDWQRLTQR
jgi:hypothetical protein